MEAGTAQGAIGGFVRLTITFVAIRATEMIVLMVGFAVVSGAFRVPAPGWSLGSLSAGVEVVRQYYIAFGYLITSAIGFLVCWPIGLLSSPLKLAIANCSIFLAHSIAVMFLLDWDLHPAIWVCWFLLIIFNLLFPFRLGRSVKWAISPAVH